MVLGGVPIWTLTHSDCRLVADEKLSPPDAKEPGDQAATAEYFCSFLSPALPAPPTPPPSPSSLPVSIPHSATHLRRSSRFRGWLSSTAVAQRSCLTVQLLKKKQLLASGRRHAASRVVRKTPAVSRSAVSRQMSVDDLAAMPQ